MAKRNIKESTATRESFYNFFGEEEFGAIQESLGHKFVGRSAEGLVFEEVSSGLCVVLKVVAKAVEFEYDEEVEEFENKIAVAKTKANKKNGEVVIVRKAKEEKA